MCGQAALMWSAVDALTALALIKRFTHSNTVNHTNTHVLSEVHAVLYEVQFLLL